MKNLHKPGAVIFAADQARLAKFYEALTGMVPQVSDAQHTVLESESFQLVLHALRGEPSVSSSSGEPPPAREDTYIKPFFPVASLAEARAKAASLGGRLKPESAEWEARGFRAVDGVDPEGNVIQVRQDAR